MNIHFSDAAREHIEKKIGNKLNEGYTLIVDYSDGDSPYSEGGNACYCAVYNKYRILVVKENDENIKWRNYPTLIDTNLGTVYFREFYAMMFDKNNVFDYSSTYGGLILKSDSGIIAEKVSLLVL